MWQGLVAGTVGAAVMTASEKIEQWVTGRPDSHVPARVLERLTGMPERRGQQSRAVNLAMHYGQGALAGVVRSLMANAGLRGPLASAKFTVVRLTNDQILENATGVGAPPQTWPRSELVADLFHKTVCLRDGPRGRRAGRPERSRAGPAARRDPSWSALRRRSRPPGDGGRAVSLRAAGLHDVAFLQVATSCAPLASSVGLEPRPTDHGASRRVPPSPAPGGFSRGSTHRIWTAGCTPRAGGARSSILRGRRST